MAETPSHNSPHLVALANLKLAALALQQEELAWESSDGAYGYRAVSAELTSTDTLVQHNVSHVSLKKFKEIMNTWVVTRRSSVANKLGQISLKQFTLFSYQEKPLEVVAWPAASENYQSDVQNSEPMQKEQADYSAAFLAKQPADIYDHAEMDNALFDLRQVIYTNSP